MKCEWREKTGLFVDGEMDPSMQQAFTTHVESCSDCSTALAEQQELKRAVRLAGKRFTAPPELYAEVRKQMTPAARPKLWLRWGLIGACLLIAGALAGSWFLRPDREATVIAQLMDQHVTMLASSNPIDVISSDRHTVKPWYQGKLPFTFNPPELAADSPFKLLGGRLVYVRRSPGAELVYQVRQHKISVFIFQARDVHENPSAQENAFTALGWQQGGLQYYVITDAAKEDAASLRELFEQANHS